MANSDPEEDLIDELKAGPLCVGISSMSGTQLKNALYYAKLIKRVDSKIPVILGGVHISIFPQQSLENDSIDIGVIGEGEMSMLELAEALSKGKAPHDIEGIAFKEDGRIVVNKKRGLVDLGALPMLDYSLLKMERYVDSARTVMIHTGRGCYFKCKFCYNNFQGARYRHFPAQTIIDDIKMLKREFGVASIKFIDDNIFSDPLFLKEIADGMINSGLGIGWHANARISEFVRFDEKMLGLIKKSGCRSIGFGIESGSQRMLDFIEKRISIKQIEQMRSILNKYDFDAFFYFMFGLPTETRDDFIQSLNIMDMVCLDQKKDILNFYCYVPYPGTELYDFVLKEGLFDPPKTIEGWASLDWNICRIESYTKSFDPSLRVVRAVFKMKKPDFIHNIIYRILFNLLKYGFLLSTMNKLATLKKRLTRLIILPQNRKSFLLP